MKPTTLFYIFFSFSVYGFAQQDIATDTTRGTATIEHKTNGSETEFKANAPQLNQIAGAPKAFYTNFWEFGDGTFSKALEPKKTYKKNGEYTVRLWATNNYDTGKPPLTRPKKITVENASDDFEDEASMDSALNLQRNREPMPDEDIVIVFSYKNTKSYTTNGKFFLFYNEAKYKADNFDLIETRPYHNERDITEDLVYSSKFDSDVYYASAEDNLLSLKAKPQDTTVRRNLPKTLEDAKFAYRNSSQLQFDNMKPNEERHVFYSLKTTKEMLKDTSAIISVRGVYVPDNSYDNHHVKDMEMEIVTSHDPNKMSSNASFLNYRLVRFKKPKFKIRFQNNGKGPATTIRLETDIPEMFDKSSIEVLDMYPKVKICPKYDVAYSCLDTTYTAKQAVFTFKNIYLPGSEQKNVKEYDSTKGFVKYRLKFSNDFHKKKTKSRTAIIFDKNEPIITNYSTTRFLPGISIGVKAGYNSFADLKNSESYFLGATISPYKSYRWYWQVELLNSFHKFDSNTEITEEIVDDGAIGFPYTERTTTNRSYNNIDWEIPVLVRYNVNNYIGLGAGIIGTISVNEKQEQSVLTEQFEGQGADLFLFDSSTTDEEVTESFTNFRKGFLVEATAGFARIGPSLGARYVFNLEDNYNYLQFYAIWKF
ncbi:PKD domain-containing protein [Winogradskyella psychrotolerans]|uniref:PKD domain-containing protein n=1 Tax=Winogradskyella psychrotolerans TaxID=1344585 RepID=UPI001C079B31|nr:PKD domain-containing protein [Winogradskyella psychrotolerans]MBU2927901.1 PKD domain-containing protein [Winogradskyella psychrotolerans]